MQPPTASSNFPAIRVPALLTFLALIVGFVVGNLFQGVAGFAPVLAAAEEIGSLWLKLLQLTILPLVIGLVVTGISQTLTAARGGWLAQRAVLMFVVVLLCAGNRIAIPDFTAGLAVITQPVHTMTGIIAQEMGEVVQGSIHYRALFVVGLVLFFLSLTINFLAQKIVRKYRISIG